MTKRKSQTLYPVNSEVVERVARIIGPQSGAAKAVAEHAQRTARGEDVIYFRGENLWVVGPRADVMHFNHQA